MGLFDRFRKRKPIVPLPQLCYDVAYFILPHYAFEDLAKLADLCLNTTTAAGPFFYVMAAQARKAEPDFEDAKRFRWHHGELSKGHEYFALEYPAPPPVDISEVPFEQVAGGGVSLVLAPISPQSSAVPAGCSTSSWGKRQSGVGQRFGAFSPRA
jgi:hypothetical protein